MQRIDDFPKTDHISIITASILVSYALLPFAQVSPRQVVFTIFGIFISINVSFYTLISLITAALAAAGADWMLREHPMIEGKSTLPHLILPALTAGAIGFPLGFLSVSPEWWMILAFYGRDNVCS